MKRIAALQVGRRELTPSDPVAEALGSVIHILTDAIEEASDLNAWVDVGTAAQILQCTSSHVAHLCRRGVLEATKVGGEWRVSRTAVEGRAPEQ